MLMIHFQNQDLVLQMNPSQVVGFGHLVSGIHCWCLQTLL